MVSAANRSQKSMARFLSQRSHSAPAKMLAAVENALPCDGEMSYEERMGCGFGACVGCTCQTKSGAKRVCKDVPVFKKGEVLA